MGHMDVIKFISSGFNIYFPIAIVLLCIATLFNLCTRALHCLGIQQFIGDDELTSELCDEGKNLVARGQCCSAHSSRGEGICETFKLLWVQYVTLCHVVERRKHERHQETAARRRDWNERYTQRRSARGTQPSSSNNDLNQYISTAEHSEYGSHHQLSSTLHARPTGAGGGYQASVNSDATRAPNVQVLGAAAAAGGRNTAVTSGQEQKQGFRKWFSRGKAAAGKKKDDDATTAMDDVRGTATTQSTSGGAPSVYSVTDGIICYYFLFCFV